MSSRRGVALVLALWLIVVLSIIAARVSSSARSATAIASNIKARAVAAYASESGVVVASSEIRRRLLTSLDPDARRRYLNSLDSKQEAEAVRLGDSRFATTYVDVNSRLDINTASRAQLARLFSFFTGPVEAIRAAQLVRDRIGADDAPPANRARYGFSPRTDLTYPAMPAARPLRALEELRRIDGFPLSLAIAAAPFLTVDGDGRINRASASDTVLAAAAGSLVDEPSRILVISRGWLPGNPITHEIQVLYAVEGMNLVMVRWQERDL